MSEYRVRLEVEISAEGNYYTPDELAEGATRWIEHALDDRDDVLGVSVTTLKVEE